MENLFTHKAIEIPDNNCKFVVSPSMIPKFFVNPSEWFRSQVLGETIFAGNTATFLGSICHYIYDNVTKDKEVNREAIIAALYEHLAKHPEFVDIVDTTDIIESFPAIATAVVNTYVIPMNKVIGKDNVLTEYSMYKCLDKEYGIYLAGTCDRIEGYVTIVDYKTVSKKPNECVIPSAYKLQLMAYADLFKKYNSSPAEEIRIVYGVKPQKTINARCIVVNEQITEELQDYYDKSIKLIVDSIKHTIDHPELAYLIFKDLEFQGMEDTIKEKLKG